MFLLERGGRQVPETRMGAHVVVVSAPLLDARLRVGAVPEPLERAVLIAERAVERFVDAILRGLAGVDEGGLDLARLQPAENRPRNELGAGVREQVARRPVDAQK